MRGDREQSHQASLGRPSQTSCKGQGERTLALLRARSLARSLAALVCAPWLPWCAPPGGPGVRSLTGAEVWPGTVLPRTPT